MAQILSGRIIGMDTSLRSTGVAVIETAGAAAIKAIEYHLIKNPASRSRAECLLNLSRGLTETLARYRPQAAAIEGIFFCKNLKTAVTLGEARGAAIVACAAAGVPIFEYSPRRVKQAVVGYGAASKDQVKKMVMTILALADEPHSDAADALAIAICHAHSIKRWNVCNPKEL